MPSPVTIPRGPVQSASVDSPEVARELTRLGDTRPEPDLGAIERGLVGVVAVVVAAAVAGATDASPLIVAGALVGAPLLVLGLIR